ncbi:MAG: HsmA family protein [Bacteroidales bacterium]
MDTNQVPFHLLFPAVLSITSALVCYTIGVWGERIQKILKGWHVLFFIFGILFDIIGTSLMTHIAIVTGKHNELHAVTGMIAVALMLVHATWAVWTYYRGSEKAKEHFNRFSIFVWSFWLIPFFVGMYIAMH